MGPLSYMQSVVDRNVVMRRMTVVRQHCTPYCERDKRDNWERSNKAVPYWESSTFEREVL